MTQPYNETESKIKSFFPRQRQKNIVLVNMLPTRPRMLLNVVSDNTGPSGKRFLTFGLPHLPNQYRNKLWRPALTNPLQLTQAIDQWIERLNTIQCALTNIPTLRYAVPFENTSDTVSETGSLAPSTTSLDPTYRRSLIGIKLP